MKIPYHPEIVIVLLLTVVVLNAFAALLFIRLDQVVHTDLYSYGLVFSNNWAQPYWAYSKPILILLIISTVTAAIAITSTLIYTRTKSKASKLSTYVFLAASATATASAIYFFTRLDNIVHNDLYQYGLQFNIEWASRYWTYSNLTLSLQGFAIAIVAVSALTIYLGTTPQIEIMPASLASYVLAAIGIAALVLSIIYGSQISALIGLGLTFWGILLKYITNEQYIKKPLLEATTLATLTTLDEMLAEANCRGKAIYLPPKYLRNIETSKAYIPKQENTKLPAPEEMQQENSNVTNSLQGIMLVPPGNELAKLFEKTLNTNFTKTDMPYIEENLPKLLIEDLEIAEDTKIQTQNDTINVTLKNTIYSGITQETKKLSTAMQSLGSPIASAIACALAKATAKPVTITKEETAENSKTITITFTLLEEQEQESKP